MRLILLALKYCKKVICTLLIFLLLTTSSAFADSKYRIDDITKNELLKKAEVTTWDKFDGILAIKSRFVVIDYYTGTYFVCERHMGGYHADIETIDKESTNALKSIYKDRENWKHRPVLIVTEDEKVYCASSFVLAHAGRDDEPFLKKVDNRSCNYGYGENYDKIKGNGMEGHFCVFVDGCKNHYNGKPNNTHQLNLEYLKKIKSEIN